VKHLYWLRIWPRGLFGVVLRHTKEANTIEIMQVSLCGCRTDLKVLSSHVRSIRIRAERGKDVSYAIVFGAIINACLVGLYVHFVPCIWWTCDWGDHDGEGVRGAIWFTLWAIFALISLVSACVFSPSQVLTLDLQNGKIHEIYVDNRDTAVKIREMLVVPSV